MVLWHNNSHTFGRSFDTVTIAFFNRYPNPYASHVLSIDTLSRHVDEEGKLVSTRLIKKMGKLPNWVKPFLGKITESWIIEHSVVDTKKGVMLTYTRNLDHTKIIKVEEYQRFEKDGDNTHVKSMVKFSSGFGIGIRNRIESWSHQKFDENIKKSRQGMAFVMERLELSRMNKTPN